MIVFGPGFPNRSPEVEFRKHFLGGSRERQKTKTSFRGVNRWLEARHAATKPINTVQSSMWKNMICNQIPAISLTTPSVLSSIHVPLPFPLSPTLTHEAFEVRCSVFGVRRTKNEADMMCQCEGDACDRSFTDIPSVLFMFSQTHQYTYV